MNTKLKIKHKRVKNKILNTFSRFSLSALVVASFFYSAPIFINFADKNFKNKEFTNNSKNILNKTLNRGKTFEEDDTWMQSNELDLLYDILEENNSEINLVRYTTSEINALFKEVKYDLEEVRDTKLVKPVDIGLLPNEIKNIGNTKKKEKKCLLKLFYL
jgi:Bax protein